MQSNKSSKERERKKREKKMEMRWMDGRKERTF